MAEAQDAGDYGDLAPDQETVPPEGAPFEVRRTARRAGAPGDEEDVWEGRGCWQHFFGSVVLALLGLVVVVAIGIAAGRGWVWATGLGLWALWWLIVWLRVVVFRWRHRYRLTTQRLFTTTGILAQTTDQLELIRVDDVRVRQGLFDRVFNVGDVVVISTDASEPERVLRGVRDPHTVAEHIRTAMRTLRQKSVFVERL